MSDFEYDSYDSTTLRTAFQNLRQAQQQGFWIGLLIGLPLGNWLITRKAVSHKLAAGPISRSLSALATGSLLYGTYIFSARQSYNDVAARINRKYSLMLNKTVTYN